MILTATILRIDLVGSVTAASQRVPAVGAAMAARCALFPRTGKDQFHGALEANEIGAIVYVKDAQLIPAMQAAGYALVAGENGHPDYFVFGDGQRVLIEQDRAGQQLYRVKQCDRGGNGSMAMQQLTLVVD